MISRSYNSGERVVAVQADFVRKVYNWMGLGLATTAIASLWTASSPMMLNIIFGSPMVFIVLIIAEVGLVIALSAAINRIQASTAIFLFFVYSALNGLTLASLLLVYTKTSVASTFFVTAGTFGAMSIYGHTTKRDLTSFGGFLTMGLIGIIIASLVNIFFRSSGLSWIITYLGVFIFVGLTAYDAQTIKEMAAGGFNDSETEGKAAVLGALRLYLDFINLFILLLRIFGDRRS